jgi:DNA-binding NarL/FixJ family response regulator
MDTEMEELSRKVAEESRRLQAELENFNFSDLLQRPNRSNESIRSVESALSRIEGRLEKVHGHTGELVNRVPENLCFLLAELKESVLERIDSLKQASTESNDSNQSTESVSPKGDWRIELFKKLTPREQSLFRACFGSGLITYKELARRLDISPISAKNIVNRLFQDGDKRRLFRKTHVRGITKVGVTEAIEQKILHSGSKDSNKNKKPVFVFEEQV